MKVYTYSEARQRLSDVLNIARTEEVVIKRRGGKLFQSFLEKVKNHHLMFRALKPRQPRKIFLMRLENQESDLPNKMFKIDGQRRAVLF